MHPWFPPKPTKKRATSKGTSLTVYVAGLIYMHMYNYDYIIEVAYMTIHVCRSSLHVPTGGVCWYIAVHLFYCVSGLRKGFIMKNSGFYLSRM